MQIVLLERIGKLGQMGDIVTVKDGYARNFLLPKGKALRATKANIAHFEKQRVQLEAVNLERKKEAELVSEKLAGKDFTAIRQAGDTTRRQGLHPFVQHAQGGEDQHDHDRHGPAHGEAGGADKLKQQQGQQAESNGMDYLVQIGDDMIVNGGRMQRFKKDGRSEQNIQISSQAPLEYRYRYRVDSPVGRVMPCLTSNQVFCYYA